MAGPKLTEALWRRLVAAAPFSPSRRFARSLRLGSRDDLIRLGSAGGGHVVAEQLLSESSVCYSAGVGNDLSFVLALIDRFGCRVDAFDPTPAAQDFAESQALPERLHFHPYGLWSEDAYLDSRDHPAGRGAEAPNYSATNVYGRLPRLRAPVKSLRSVMRSLGHERIDLLTMDIEGAEYQVIGSIVAEQIPINALVLEFHKDPKAQGMRDAVAALTRARLFPHHVDGYEVTFVRIPLLPPARRAPSFSPGRIRLPTSRR